MEMRFKMSGIEFGKPLLDNGSMPEFVNYVGVKKPICMRFTLYGT